MKIAQLFGVLTLSLVLFSCSGSDKKASIAGRWRLEKEEKHPSNGGGVEFANQPTYVILNLDSNGYFILYDTFINPSWKSKGLPLIAQRSKGQWEFDGKTLKLNHQDDDSSYVEVLKISEVNATTLVTQGQNNKSNIFKTYGR